MIPSIASAVIINKENGFKPKFTNNYHIKNLNKAHLNMNSHLSKETEQSTKNSTKDNFLLDYTFLSHRSQLSTEKSKCLIKSKEYIFDLTNTWELNIELLENSIKIKNESENEELLKIIDNIKIKFEKKKALRKQFSDIRGKILIEKQIIEEFKRKIDENAEYYKDQLKEYEENRDNKEEYIKIFEKKLKEVEIYVQKNTKTNPKFEIYKDFKINDFICENTDSIKRRDVLRKEYYNAREMRDEIIRENVDYKKDLNFSFTNEESNPEGSKNCNNIYNDEICNIGNKKGRLNEESKEKLKKLFYFYKNQVRVIAMKTRLMRNYFDKMVSKLKIFSFSHLKKNLTQNVTTKQGEITEREEAGEYKEINNHIDKSGVNLDITKKMATFMDFSVILNKRNSYDETQLDFGLNKTGLGKANNDLWDFSVIGKN